MKRCSICNHCGNCVKREIVATNYRPMILTKEDECDICAMPLDVLYN